MYVSPINEIVRLQQNLKAAGQQKRGRHPVFNANMFYPRKLENELNDLLRAELERIFLENMAVALNGSGLRDDVAEMNAAPVVLSSGFLEKSKNFAERVNANAGDTYQKQVELIIGRPYYPPTAQREILEAWHDEFQALCISAGQDGKKKIAMTIAVAKEKGWNKKQTEEAVRALLPAETKHRAELIARTETGKLNSRCVRETYAQTGIKYYKWLTTIDGRERENHAAMNGQICDVNDPDVIYEENPENPLRPIQKKKTGEMVHLHPGQDFQCRCTMVMWEPEIDGKYEVTEEHEREEAERLAAEEKANNEAEAARLAELERQRLEREAEEERKRKEAEAAYIAEVERKAKERARKRVAAAIKKAQESNRALQILQAANARHAKRTEAERQDIIGRWNERRRKREIMAIAERRHANRSSAQAAAILKEVQARIDARNKLRGLLAELKGISGINTASATTALNKAKTSSIKTAIKKLEGYKAEIEALTRLDDPLAVAKTWGLEEAKKVNAAVEMKLKTYEGMSLARKKSALEFEIEWVENHKKYKTWEVAMKAYQKELKAVEKAIAWEEAEKLGASALSSLSGSKSVKAKAAIKAIEKAKAAGDLEAYKKAVEEAEKVAAKLNKPKASKKGEKSIIRQEFEGRDLSWNKQYINNNLDRDDFTKNLLIEEVLKDQGFMNLPTMVNNEDFKDLLKKDHFLATRTYGSDSKGEVQKLTVQAREGLYNGDFYVKCQGNNVHGFGMYFACDKTLGNNARMNVRVWHGYEKTYHYEEFCCLSKSAKIIEEDDIEREYLKRGLSSAPTKNMKDILNKCIKKGGYNVHHFKNEIQSLPSLTKEELDFIKNGLSFWKTVPDAELMKDPSKIPFHKDVDDHGILAARMGYDALYDSGTNYGVMLNRSKMILLNRQKDQRTTEEIFKENFGV